MWDKAVESAFTAGPFAVLFVVLLYWVLSTNNDRETRYITVIETQAKGVLDIEMTKKDVEQVKIDVQDVKQDIKILLHEAGKGDD